MSEIHPDAEALFEQGIQQLEKVAFDQAAASFRTALESAPHFLEARVNLGWALHNLGALDEAASSYQRALELDPTCLQACLNLGRLRLEQKRFEEAETVYAQALCCHPDSPAVWSNLGALKAVTKQEDEAEMFLRKALELNPDYAKARFNLSYVLLRQQRLEEGWEALEGRELSPYTSQFNFPPWRGEDLTGKSLLIGVEKGYGDMIQFARYALLLKERGAARIGLLCHGALTRLFHSLEGVDQVFPMEEGLPNGDWDFWALPLSLPLHCRTRMDSIPASLPYLYANPELAQEWRARVPGSGLRVGLAWKGNPQFENDADRSLPHLSCLLPLASVENASFVSLQKGPGEKEPKALPPSMTVADLSAWIRDFADLAAIIANLDLVISVDSAVAHLAGALGKPCWILLPDYKTDWRWFKEREDSPWYPGVARLFRQTEAGLWPPLIERVAAELKRFRPVS